MEFKKSKKTTWFQDTATLLMPLLLVLSELTNSSAFFMAAVLISLLVIRRPFVIFPAYFIASLSSNYFSPMVGLGAGRVFSLILIFSLLLNKDSYSNSGFKNTGVYCIVLVVFNLFSTLFSVSGIFFTFFVMLQNLMILFFLQRQRDVDLDRLSTMLFLSSAIVVLGLLYQATIMGVSLDMSDRYTLESINQNNYAMMCAQLGAVMVAYAFISKKTLIRLISIGFLVISLILIFLAGSRSSLVGVLGAMAVLVLLSFKGNAIKTTILAVFLVVPLIIIYNYAVNSDLYLLQRFSVESVVDSGGSGRTDLIKRIFTEIMPNYFLFGVGIGGVNIMAAGIPKPCHNILIDPLSQIGVIGVVLYWMMIIPIIAKSIKLIQFNKTMSLPIALFFACLINGIGETIFYEKFFWNAITLCTLFCNVINSSNNYHGKIQNVG